MPRLRHCESQEAFDSECLCLLPKVQVEQSTHKRSNESGQGVLIATGRDFVYAFVTIHCHKSIP